MLKEILRTTGLYVYFKYWRKKYLPTKAQRAEDSHIAEKLKFYKQFIDPGNLCFDVGANIGNRTEAFLALGAKVVAVEPQSECARMMSLRFRNRINLVQKALGANEAEGTIYISETSEISSLSKDWIDSVSKSRFQNSEWKKSETVPVTTLDQLISENGVPKFCKIDVEGYEEHVLKGLTHPIPYISLEYTIPERLDQCFSCLDQLSKLGAFECNYTVGENMGFEFPGWVSQSTLRNRILEIAPQALFGDIYIHFH